MNKYGHLEFTGGWKRKDCHVVASGNYSHANGYYAPNPSEKEQTALTNSDLNIVNLFSSVSYRGLDIQLGAQYKDAGAGMFYGFGSQDQFDATRTAFGSAHYGHNWGTGALKHKLPIAPTMTDTNGIADNGCTAIFTSRRIVQQP
ncbi:MAG: hypothetical protein IJ920_00570 [Paludibacteraceae bacterium]|nr:hypothetical protein [Paludibacteraceae bacterium]